jgi:hypothetical protein
MRVVPVGSARAPTGSLERARDWVEARALFIVGVSAVLVLGFAGIPSHFSQDGWLALIAGRLIAAHGIPQHDYFTQMAHGVRWVDQQWLAQLLMYELQRLGGMQLLTVAYVLLTGAAFAGAIAMARDLGGEDLHVLAILPPGAFFYLATAVSIRTQGFAYPLFIATLYLLASDIRSDQPRDRTWFAFPILILWANLHGSVTLGIGLAMIYGLALLARNFSAGGVAHTFSARALAFIVLTPLTLFATPYGTGIVHYYRVTLANPEFGRLVSEWKPVTSTMLLAVPLFILIAVTAYVVLRRWRRTPLFDLLVLAMLAAAAIDAVRNITWFGLAVVVLVPSAITRLKGGHPAPLRKARINRVFAITMIALTALSAAVILTRPTSWFTSTYPTKAIPTLDRLLARDPGAKIFADVHYADWLIWEQPQRFSGRVAYDTSLELLTSSQLRAIGALDLPGHRPTPALLRPYAIWVLDPVNKAGDRALLSGRGVRVVLRTKRVLIATYTGDGSHRP